jgi:hypothetical protein
MSERVAGTNLQILLELGGAFARLEGNAAHQFSWTVLGGVEVRAFVVAPEARPHVVGKPDVGLLWVREAPEQIDMVHGVVQRWLAILLRQEATEDKCVARSAIRRTGPTSLGATPCYVGHTSLSAALRAKYGRGSSSISEPGSRGIIRDPDRLCKVSIPASKGGSWAGRFLQSLETWAA